ncbi:MAG: undecaprenyl-diphosphate phosphatase [candidate division WOR-3 bacterium]
MKEIALGFLQGITEFLPISSSGHLLFLQEVFKFNLKGIGIETLFHLATFFSVIVYFRKRLINYYLKNWFKILLGILPASLFALLFRNKIKEFFEDPKYLFLFFLLNGFYLLSSRIREGGEGLDNKKAFLIGVMQIFALLPGISRSGTTITTALLLNINPKESFEFSFYMYLPLVLGAFILEIGDLKYLEVLPSLAGFIFAFLSGLFALFLIEGSIKKKLFPFFGIYTIILSIFSFFLLR